MVDYLQAWADSRHAQWAVGRDQYDLVWYAVAAIVLFALGVTILLGAIAGVRPTEGSVAFTRRACTPSVGCHEVDGEGGPCKLRYRCPPLLPSILYDRTGLREHVDEIENEPHIAGLQFLGCSKRYGATQALSQVTFGVMPGSVVALVGANGAGKTTLLHALVGLVSLDTGDIQLDGVPSRSVAAKRRIAFMLDDLPCPVRLTARELVELTKASVWVYRRHRRTRCAHGPDRTARSATGQLFTRHASQGRFDGRAGCLARRVGTR